LYENLTVSGRTNNPWDLRRTPAGSSGGEGSLLGSGASLLGIGSDVAGSCRMPAMFNGVWGHKPSPHLVSPGYIEMETPGIFTNKV
jgi:fatty acid amide hydrolase 2